MGRGKKGCLSETREPPARPKGRPVEVCTSCDGNVRSAKGKRARVDVNTTSTEKRPRAEDLDVFDLELEAALVADNGGIEDGKSCRPLSCGPSPSCLPFGPSDSVTRASSTGPNSPDYLVVTSLAGAAGKGPIPGDVAEQAVTEVLQMGLRRDAKGVMQAPDEWLAGVQDYKACQPIADKAALKSAKAKYRRGREVLLRVHEHLCRVRSHLCSLRGESCAPASPLARATFDLAEPALRALELAFSTLNGELAVTKERVKAFKRAAKPTKRAAKPT